MAIIMNYYLRNPLCDTPSGEKSRADKIFRKIHRAKLVKTQRNDPWKWRKKRSARHEKTKICRTGNAMVFWILIILFVGDGHIKMTPCCKPAWLQLREGILCRRSLVHSLVAARSVAYPVQAAETSILEFPHEIGAMKSFRAECSHRRYHPFSKNILRILIRTLRSIAPPIYTTRRLHNDRLADSTNIVVNTPSQARVHSTGPSLPPAPRVPELPKRTTIASRTATSALLPPGITLRAPEKSQAPNTPYSAAQSAQTTDDVATKTPPGGSPDRESKELSGEGDKELLGEDGEDKCKGEGDDGDEGGEDENYEDGEDDQNKDNDQDDGEGDGKDGDDNEGDEDDDDGEDEDDEDDEYDDDDDDDDNEDDDDDDDDDDNEDDDENEWTEVDDGYGNELYQVLTLQARTQHLEALNTTLDYLMAIIEG